MTERYAGDIALELERLHGAVDKGFARVDGSLALLVQRSDQTTDNSPTTNSASTTSNGPASHSRVWPPWYP